jgi:hypothetical protein
MDASESEAAGGWEVISYFRFSQDDLKRILFLGGFHNDRRSSRLIELMCRSPGKGPSANWFESAADWRAADQRVVAESLARDSLLAGRRDLRMRLYSETRVEIDASGFDQEVGEIHARRTVALCSKIGGVVH